MGGKLIGWFDVSPMPRRGECWWVVTALEGKKRGQTVAIFSEERQAVRFAQARVERGVQ